jgi:hypothetical protein
MSLVRLLTAGKSLVGGVHDSAARYRMSDPRAMPRFGSARNPFQSKESKATDSQPAAPANFGVGNGNGNSAPSPRDEERVAATQAENLPTAETANATASVQPVEAVKEEAVPVEQPVAAKPSAGKSGGSKRISQWMAKVAAWMPKKRSREAIVPQSAAPIQGELSLEKVRVMRNDLSDTDLEIVSAKPATVRRAPAGSESASGAEPVQQELAGNAGAWAATAQS